MKGTTIICSRYAYSGVAYSHAKGMNLQWCKAPESGLQEPDVVIFLNVDVEKAAKRRELDEIYDRVETQKKVLKSFQELLKNEKIVRVSYNCVFVEAPSMWMEINLSRMFTVSV